MATTCTRALGRLRTCRRVGSTRRRGNHMHDHSRFQRDIDDVTGVSLSLSLSLLLLLLLLLLTKVTRAQYRKRFRASYIVREVLSVRERDTERERERERERDGSDVTIVALKLAMNLHFPFAKKSHNWR